jgi:hypothetical protein
MHEEFKNYPIMSIYDLSLSAAQHEEYMEKEMKRVKMIQQAKAKEEEGTVNQVIQNREKNS